MANGGDHDCPNGYFWPAPEAVLSLNKRLGLPATGNEQDWEVQLADWDRLPEFVRILDSGLLDFEAQSALALLVTCSIVYEGNEPAPETLAGIRRVIERDPPLRDRMRSYWGRLWAGEVLPEDQALFERTQHLLGGFDRFDPFT